MENMPIESISQKLQKEQVHRVDKLWDEPSTTVLPTVSNGQEDLPASVASEQSYSQKPCY